MNTLNKTNESGIHWRDPCDWGSFPRLSFDPVWFSIVGGGALDLVIVLFADLLVVVVGPCWPMTVDLFIFEFKHSGSNRIQEIEASETSLQDKQTNNHDAHYKNKSTTFSFGSKSPNWLFWWIQSSLQTQQNKYDKQSLWFDATKFSILLILCWTLTSILNKKIMSLRDIVGISNVQWDGPTGIPLVSQQSSRYWANWLVYPDWWRICWYKNQ